MSDRLPRDLNHPMWAELLREYGNAKNLRKHTGLLPPISGGAGEITGGPEGYNETADLLTRTVDGVPIDDLYEEIIATLRVLNASRAPLLNWLTFTTTEAFEQIMPHVQEDFEEADEFGQPKGIRLGKPWNMGYDMRYFDLGIRYTFRFLGRAPAAQIRALNNTALDADQRLMLKTVLTQIFTNVTRSATLEDTDTVVNVYPFYNGDVTTLPVAPPAWKSYSHLNTHTHYLPSGGAAFVSGDLDDAYEHIYHHGYIQAGSDVFVIMPRALTKIARKFRVAGTGDSYDFFPVAGQPDSRFLGSMVGDLPGRVNPLDGFPGHIGDYGDIHIIEEDLVPAGYFVMWVSGGAMDPGNPVAIRDHQNPALRGLKLIPQYERYPLRESFYHHALGSGTRYPGKGVVVKIGTGAYTVPDLTTTLAAGPGGR